MYCYSCGRSLPADAAFCPQCGTPRYGPPESSQQSHLHPAWVVLALLMFPPLGLILMWTASGWNDDLKWGISGLFFPPLWTSFLWKVPWLPYVVEAFIALLVIRGVFERGLSVVGAVVILTIVTILLLITKPRRRSEKQLGRDPSADLRQKVDDKLDTCNELIADIEGTIALQLLPAGNSVRRLYTRALEARSEGARLFDRATSLDELRAADERATRALHSLRAVQEEISDTSV